MHPANQLTPEEIQARLAARQAEPYIFPANERFGGGEPQPAAVLIPLLREDHRWHVLFIRRTSVRGDRHSGQVAFPGGRMDPEDASLEATALREAREEIGLAPQEVRILGQLEHSVTISNYHLTPVVGLMPWPIELTAAPNEVERVFTIPLDWLADPAHYQIKRRRGLRFRPHPVIYFERYAGELLWGVSAHITLAFLDALGLR